MLLSSNDTVPASVRRAVTSSMRTLKPANSRSSASWMLAARKVSEIGPASSRAYRMPTTSSTVAPVTPAILAVRLSALFQREEDCDLRLVRVFEPAVRDVVDRRADWPEVLVTSLERSI